MTQKKNLVMDVQSETPKAEKNRPVRKYWGLKNRYIQSAVWRNEWSASYGVSFSYINENGRFIKGLPYTEDGINAGLEILEQMKADILTGDKVHTESKKRG